MKIKEKKVRTLVNKTKRVRGQLKREAKNNENCGKEGKAYEQKNENIGIEKENESTQLYMRRVIVKMLRKKN